MEERRTGMRFAAWHAAASGLLLLCVAARYFRTSPLPDALPPNVFVALAAPAYFVALAVAASLPVLAVAATRPRRLLVPLSVLLQGALLVFVAIDTQVYDLYRSHVDGVVLGLLTSGFAWQILGPTSADLRDLAVLLAVALALQAVLARAALALARNARWSPAWLAVVVVPFALAQAMHAWADAGSDPSITRVARVLPWMPALTAKRWLAARGWQPSGAEVASASGESDLSYPLAPTGCPDDARRRARIVVVVIEQWRFDELDATTTPNLFRLGEDALVLERHFSTGSASRYGVFGLLYGLHGDYWDAMLAEQRGPVLIDELVATGARFFVGASAPLARPEFDRTVFAALRTRVPFVLPGGAPASADRRITDAFSAFADDVGDDPFFAFLYYDSPHSMDVPEGWSGPFQPARRWGSRLALGRDTDPTPLANAHRNSIHYVDSLVARVLDALRRNGLYDRTAIVVTGDHGEEFDDLGLGYWGHNGNFARFQTQVGMVLRIPGRPPGRIDALTSHVDVPPTLLAEVLGCRAAPESYSNGRSVFDASPRAWAVATGGSLGIGVIEPERITTVDRFGDVRVFTGDLASASPDGAPARLADVFRELTAFRGGGR